MCHLPNVWDESFCIQGLMDGLCSLCSEYGTNIRCVAIHPTFVKKITVHFRQTITCVAYITPAATTHSPHIRHNNNPEAR
mmetsp:Transcript_12087/g.29153  ORF Transcript_12087/g.29153 Transcript_12087/m.29153 type:complete len:80 (-) Transcript_12087:372-611(-)